MLHDDLCGKIASDGQRDAQRFLDSESLGGSLGNPGFVIGQKEAAIKTLPRPQYLSE